MKLCHRLSIAVAVFLLGICGPAAAQQQFDAGGKARVSLYCKGSIPGDTACPAGNTTAPTGVTPVATAIDPGTTIVKSSALESNHVLKSSAGNLYSVYVTTGAVQGWLLTYNGTAAPTAAGAAIAPVDCVYAAANATTGIAMGGAPPDPYATGIVVIFSSSGCLTNTASATAYFKGRVK